MRDLQVKRANKAGKERGLAGAPASENPYRGDLAKVWRAGHLEGLAIRGEVA